MATIVLLAAAARVGAGDGTPPEWDLRVSRPYGLLHFLETLHGEHGSTTLLEAFEASRFPRTDEIASIRDRYPRLDWHASYSFPGFPTYRARQHDSADLVRMMAARSDDLGTFADLTYGIVPADAHRTLLRILEDLEPVYDEVVWDRSEAPARARVRELRDLIQEHGVRRLGQRIQRFYGSPWEDEVPLIVRFYPIPGTTGNPESTAVGNTLLCGLVAGTRDLPFYAGLIAHEMSHMLFEAQPMDLQHEIEEWFIASSSPHRRFAYHMLNEGLATALGHWVHVQIDESAEVSYDDPYVRATGDALFPLVKEYLDQGRAMDASFVKRYLEICEDRFPEALYEYDLLFRDYFLLTDADWPARRALAGEIERRFPSGSSRYEFFTPILSEENLERLKGSFSTRLIVVTRDHGTTLRRLGEVFPGRVDASKLDPDKDLVLATVDEDGLVLILVSVHRLESFSRAVDLMQDEGRIDLERPWIEIP